MAAHTDVPMITDFGIFKVIDNGDYVNIVLPTGYVFVVRDYAHAVDLELAGAHVRRVIGSRNRKRKAS